MLICRIKNLLKVLVVLVLAFSCQGSRSKLNWNYLEEKYSNNDLKLKAIRFLKQNIDSLYSEKLVFYDQNSGKIINIRLDTISSEKSLKEILTKRKLSYKWVKVRDVRLLNIKQIDTYIDEAFKIREKYVWSKNISDSLFIHYVLPYKIAAEFPTDWRKHFFSKFKQDLDSLNQIDGIDVQYVTRFLVEKMDKMYKYDSENYLSSPFPDIDELLYSSKGDCYRISYLYSYMLRAAGIPCVVDIVPLWGSKNSGHAEYSSLDSTGSLASNVATSHKAGLNRAAKVFRLTFDNNGFYSKDIHPHILNYQFLIPSLKFDNLIDVTDQHAETFDVNYSIKKINNQSPFAYICVYNYGKWVPVFWGKINNGNVIFPKMNSNIIYRVGLPDYTGIIFSDDLFFIDPKGKSHFIKQSHSTINNARLSKTNSGEFAFLDSSQVYELHKLSPRGIWLKVGNYATDKNRIITVPKIELDTFYSLFRIGQNNKYARPFLYSNNEQEWW